MVRVSVILVFAALCLAATARKPQGGGNGGNKPEKPQGGGNGGNKPEKPQGGGNGGNKPEKPQGGGTSGNKPQKPEKPNKELIHIYFSFLLYSLVSSETEFLYLHIYSKRFKGERIKN